MFSYNFLHWIVDLWFRVGKLSKNWKFTVIIHCDNTDIQWDNISIFHLGDVCTCVIGWIYTGSSSVPFHDVAWSRCSTVPNVSVGISQEVLLQLWQSFWSDNHTLQCWSRSHWHFHCLGLSAWPGKSWGQCWCVWMRVSDEEQPCQHGPDSCQYWHCSVWFT